MMFQTKFINTKVFFNSTFETIKINTDRLTDLKKVAFNITNEYKKNGSVNLNFICKNNSYKSQIAQVWSAYASTYYNLNIDSYSGGIYISSIHRKTIKTLQKVGFGFNIDKFSHSNPTYLINFEGCKKPILGFSKLYDDVENKKPFIIITTCSIDDENYTSISNALSKHQLSFNNSKHFDELENQNEMYSETNKQIAAEIHTIFKIVNNSI